MKSKFYRRLKKTKAFLKHPATRRIAIFLLILAAIFFCHGKYNARREERALQQAAQPLRTTQTLEKSNGIAAPVAAPSPVNGEARPQPPAPLPGEQPPGETDATAQETTGAVKSLLNGEIPSPLAAKAQEAAASTTAALSASTAKAQEKTAALQTETQTAAEDAAAAVNQAAESVKAAVNQAAEDVKAAVTEPPAPATPPTEAAPDKVSQPPAEEKDAAPSEPPAGEKPL